MSDILSRLSRASQKKPLEPREIFMSLPQRDKKYQYPRDVQTDVWSEWYSRRNLKNNIIKMNTGSGKTVVGLMILQSCLNENNGSTVYVVPDKYLVNQVCDEAKKLGIKTVIERDDYDYTEKKAILVMPIHALVNGRSVFGMRNANNYPIDNVLIDDIHACLETISSQYTIRIPQTHTLYKELIDTFSSLWKSYNNYSYTDIVELNDPQKRAMIPFWIWRESIPKVYELMSKHNNDDKKNTGIFFHLPLLEEYLETCNCIITSRFIEITPYGIPIEKIKSFENAKRRIFMSATLSDDSVFVSTLGLKKDDVKKIIVPHSANDIGDRLILFPQYLNNTISDVQIKEKVFSVAEKYNVVIIVPSKKRAKFWDPEGYYTITKDNILAAVNKLKNGHVGCCVLVNRYDGIDLPDDACRVLVIDGLPPLYSEYESYLHSVDPMSTLLLREQVQRIEQGMGRGVRSNSDSCCVVLMGEQLADALLRNNGTRYFSKATEAQFGLSRELWELLREEEKPSIEKIFEVARYSLERNVEWIQMSKERLSSVEYSSIPQYDPTTIYLREAFEYSASGQWKRACDAVDQAVESVTESSSKGYLLQIKAAYYNHIDQARSQQILLSAYSLNKAVLKPLEGIQYDKAINKLSQVVGIISNIDQGSYNQNEYVIHINAIISHLSFSPNTDEFEAALKDLGEVLGFVSTRPEKEINNGGPDNLWAIGNNQYFVIECKSGAVVDEISKEYCNQLGGSIRWFDSEYGTDCVVTPILVHPATSIHELATPVERMRIITSEEMQRFVKHVRSFAVAIAQSENWKNENSIQKLLTEYQLRGVDIIPNYTVSYRQ